MLDLVAQCRCAGSLHSLAIWPIGCSLRVNTRIHSSRFCGPAISAVAASMDAPPVPSGQFTGLHVPTGIQYRFQWCDGQNNVHATMVTDDEGTLGMATLLRAFPAHPHNHEVGTTLHVHHCAFNPCDAFHDMEISSNLSIFHVLGRRRCDWCWFDGYSDLADIKEHPNGLPTVAWRLHWRGGSLLCGLCEDLDEPRVSPNNRQRCAAWLLHMSVLPVAVRMGPVCALIARFVAANTV